MRADYRVFGPAGPFPVAHFGPAGPKLDVDRSIRDSPNCHRSRQPGKYTPNRHAAKCNTVFPDNWLLINLMKYCSLKFIGAGDDPHLLRIYSNMYTVM